MTSLLHDPVARPEGDEDDADLCNLGRPGLAACPACQAAPAAERLAELRKNETARLMLSLPTAHCAACISTVEHTLADTPGVRSARVNLTLKRVSVEADPDVTADFLVDRLAGVGYEAHELDSGLLSATETDKQSRDLLMRLGVAFFATMNVMLLSVAVWSGAEAATRDMFHWISAMIALPTVVFSGQPFFRSAFRALKVGRLNMDVPISLALILASGVSLFETAHNGQHAYFDAALMLTFFLLVGRYLDQRTRALARSAAEELAALEVPKAVVLDGAEEVTKPIDEVRSGDRVLVRPGGRMPVDGVVIEGSSEIDRGLLTGESLPVFATAGMRVSAGEVNLTGPLVLEVTAAGRSSSLHQMADLVAIAETAKSRYTSIADKASRIYAPSVHVLSLTAFLAWLWASGGDLRLSVNIAMAVLIITCPCALGLAVPAVVTAASGRLFRLGLLIKNATALERLAEVDTVVFDKTGTLTLGLPEPVGLDEKPAEVLALAAALAAGSAHPLARALAEDLATRGVVPQVLEDLREVPGHGIEAQLGGKLVRLGRAEWVGAEPLAVTATYLRRADGTVTGFAFADHPRQGAEDLVTALKARGMAVHLVSGDAAPVVEDLARRLGIAEWDAAALPQDKVDYLDRLARDGRRVLMVGDGLNDTAALAAAHVSISPASALDAARTASDIVLLGNDLAPIAEATGIARRAVRRMKENFAISALYNAIAVPLALFGHATPLAAAIAMSMSSITVSLNALRLNAPWQSSRS